MQPIIVSMKMIFTVLVILLLNGFTDAQDYQNYDNYGETAKEVKVSGSVSINGVNCREGEKLGSCCPPHCEATCDRPQIYGSSGVSQNRKSHVCLEKCVCKKPLVRGRDRKCVPFSQCPGKNGQYNQQ